MKKDAFSKCLPVVIAGKTSTLAMRLFSYFSIILLIILLLETLVETTLVKIMLHIPYPLQERMLDLSHQAEMIIEKGDMQALASWEQKQDEYLFIVDKLNQAISGRDMHPHFVFKLTSVRYIDSILQGRLNQPVIALPLKSGHYLMIQFPIEQHPAQYFSLYSGFIKIFIAVLILSLFSLLLARYLQSPLNKLKEASRRLAEGDFSVRVSEEVGNSVSEFYALACDFDHMSDRIQALAEKQKRLIRDVSHELRTPLARHNLVLHLLRKKTPIENQYLLDRLDRESDEMNLLVSEILEFSRLGNASYDANLIALQLEPFCQIQVLENKMTLLAGQVLQTNLLNKTALVMADSRLLLRVINNLIVNASKYAGEQAIICLSVKPFLLDSERFVEICVEDDGYGIKEQHLKQMFDPFTRLEDARDKQSGGYGLGLAIVKESMAVMKGRVIAENREQGGLRIRLLLPIASSDP